MDEQEEQDDVKIEPEVNEDVGAYCRAVGKGAGEYVFLVGLEIDADDTEFQGFFQPLVGTYDDYFSGQYHHPLILSEQKAKRSRVSTFLNKILHECDSLIKIIIQFRKCAIERKKFMLFIPNSVDSI